MSKRAAIYVRVVVLFPASPRKNENGLKYDSLFINWEGAGGRVGDTVTVDFSVGPAITPTPAALPLFATGLGGLGLLGWRRKRKAQAVA